MKTVYDVGGFMVIALLIRGVLMLLIKGIDVIEERTAYKSSKEQ